MIDGKEIWLKSMMGVTVNDPTLKVRIIKVDLIPVEVDRKFNPLWLWNFVAVFICVLIATIITYVSVVYGGVLAYVACLYCVFQLGRIASLYIIDPVHKFWNIKYEYKKVKRNV
jgi:membrane protein YdbS with pleckstrin-like domain